MSIGAVDAMRDELLGLSHAIHGEPELALEEFKACANLAGAVEGHGIAVSAKPSDWRPPTPPSSASKAVP